MVWTRSALAAVLVVPALLRGQGFDSSNNQALGGYYYVRHVVFSGVGPDTKIARARAITGTITFNGAGGYSIVGQLADNATGNVQTSPFHAEGKYSVASSGMAEIENPLDQAQTIRAGVGAGPVVTGSSTEGDFHDIFIAIPVGGDINSNAAIQGDWQVGYVDFAQGKSTLVRSARFAMSADGQGGLGSIVASGNALNLGSGPAIE
jgi:hypothetical protein